MMKTIGIALVAAWAARTAAGTARDDNIYMALYELGRERGEPFDAASGIASLDFQVPALDIAQVLQSRDDIATCVVRLGRRRRAKTEQTNPVHLPHRLPLGEGRRGEQNQTG